MPEENGKKNWNEWSGWCRVVKSMVCDAPLSSLALLADGVTLAVGSTRGAVQVYDLRSMQTPLRSLAAHATSVQRLAFQPPLKVSHSSPTQHITI